jgi:hypothetical protein
VDFRPEGLRVRVSLPLPGKEPKELKPAKTSKAAKT